MRSGITLAHTHSGRGTVRKELEDSAGNNGKRHVCRKKEGVHCIWHETYFRNLNVQFICLETKMTPKTKFRMLNMQFASSETRMRLEANFREPNLHLTSSHRDKFEDSW